MKHFLTFLVIVHVASISASEVCFDFDAELPGYPVCGFVQNLGATYPDAALYYVSNLKSRSGRNSLCVDYLEIPAGTRGSPGYSSGFGCAIPLQLTRPVLKVSYCFYLQSGSFVCEVMGGDNFFIFIDNQKGIKLTSQWYKKQLGNFVPEIRLNTWYRLTLWLPTSVSSHHVDILLEKESTDGWTVLAEKTGLDTGGKDVPRPLWFVRWVVGGGSKFYLDDIQIQECDNNKESHK